MTNRAVTNQAGRAGRAHLRPANRPTGTRRPVAAFFAAVLLLVFGLALPALAQERSDTGRRKAPRAVPSKPDPQKPAPEAKGAGDPAAPPFSATTDRWLAGISLGLADAGDLFRVETDTEAPASWGPPGDPQFSASRFTATVDPGSVVGAHVARRLGQGRWWLRADLSHGSGDVAAEALLGQGGDVFFYDRVTFLSAGLGMEARLTSWPSHPYLAAGLAVCRLTAQEYDGLDDSGLGARAALGYRQRLGRGFLGAEIGLQRSSLDYKDFRPPVAVEPEPAITYEPAADLWRIEFRVAASRAW